MPDPEQPSSASMELAPGVSSRPGGVRLQFTRSAGPGGQNVNKVSTRAILWVSIDALIGLTDRAKTRLRKLAGSRLTLADELQLQSQEHRSQQANKDDVFERLRELIVAAQHEPKRRRPTKPTRASQRRRMDSKRQRGQLKQQRGSSSDD